MKTIIETKIAYSYNELSQTAKQNAVNNAINDMIEYEMSDHYENWPEFKKAIDKADQMKTPWFYGSYIWDYCKGSIVADLEDRGEIFNVEGDWI